MTPPSMLYLPNVFRPLGIFLFKVRIKLQFSRKSYGIFAVWCRCGIFLSQADASNGVICEKYGDEVA